jgi:hypothetical protein
MTHQKEIQLAARIVNAVLNVGSSYLRILDDKFAEIWASRFLPPIGGMTVLVGVVQVI